jgi:hypothetical protein
MAAEPTPTETTDLTAKRHAFNAAIAENDALLRSLSERIVAAPEHPLLQGEWTVRDAMCHVAARSNGVTMVQAISSGAFNTENAGATFDIDAINRQQIAERVKKSARDLIDETIAGHARAITELAHLDDETLASMISLPIFEQPVAFIDLLMMSGPEHDAAHLAEIQAALDAQ